MAKTRSQSTPAKPAKTSKKATTKKKTTSKKVARKAAAKKPATKKKASKKKPATKKSVTKKSTAKKPTTRKKAAKKSAASKKTTTKKPIKKKSTKKTTKKPVVAAKPAAPAKPVKLEDMTLEQRMELDWTPAKLRRAKSGLTKKDLLEYRAMLLEKRAEIVGDVKGMESARSASLDDLAHMPLHMADIGTDTFEQEFTLGLIESERRLLNEINQALHRMEDKTYGVCMASGQPIGKARLEFKPWAKYCIEVARLREKRGLQPHALACRAGYRDSPSTSEQRGGFLSACIRYTQPYVVSSAGMHSETSSHAMPDANDTAPPQGPPVTTVGQRPRAWVLFAAIVAVFLAGDLWLKAWSFEHIAGVPLKVTAGEDGPRVYVPRGTELRAIDGTVLTLQADDSAGDWVPAPREKTAHPASAIPRHKPTPLVPGVLDLQLTLNTGAVFGLGQGARWLFVAVSVLATGVILVLVWRSPAGARVYHVALGMILAGALGNLYDRVRFSAVRDMLHMLPETNLWPWIFNLADVALVVGVCVVLVMSFFDGRGRAPA